MLLGVVKGEFWSGELPVDLAGDAALEASHGFLFGVSFVDASGDVVAGSFVADRACDHDPP